MLNFSWNALVNSLVYTVLASAASGSAAAYRVPISGTPTLLTHKALRGGSVTPDSARVVCMEDGYENLFSVPLDGGRAQMDEVSTLGETTIAEFYQERGFTVSTLSPDLFPLQAATLADLEGGDRDRNAATLRRILNGEERGPKREAVLLNAAAALFVAGRCRSLLEGWEAAAKLIDSGAASAKLDSLAKARPN